MTEEYFLTELIALITIIIWPVIPIFWTPVHFAPGFFRKLGLFTYVMPLLTWLPAAYLIYRNRAALLSSQVEFSPVIQISGIVLLVSGTLIHIWTGKLLSIWGLLGLPEVYMRAKGQLVADGAFSIVRHPTYLAHTLMFSGVYLISGVLAALIVTLLDLLFVQALIIPLEEKELMERFGDEYREYARRTPRFLPRISSKSS